MIQNRSFRDYIASRFHSELFEVVSKYITIFSNELKLQLWQQSIAQFEDLGLSKLNVLFVYVDDQPKMKICFDVVVDAEIIDQQSPNHYSEPNVYHLWLKLGCFGDLDCDLDDFQVLSIKIYDRNTDHENSLSDELIPYICTEGLDKVALDFVARYYPEALEKPMPIDPYELAHRMSLEVKQKDISKDCSIFGQIFFQDSEGIFYDRQKDKMVVETVKAKTIFVDLRAYFLRNLGSVNNTIVHECVHWDKHRKAIKLENFYDNDATKIVCTVTGSVAGKQKEAIEWIEWQANKLAPRIQMPFIMFQLKAQELIEKYKIELQSSELVDVLEPVIDELADFFEVSRLAAKIRMIDTGYYEARNVFIYIDGKYIRPYTYTKDAIGENQTFCIDLADALTESVVSSGFKERLQTGDYLYIESHFCLNDPKYIEDNELTEYARLHLDECCLIFDLKISADNQYDENYHFLCFLNRDMASNVIFEARFSDCDTLNHAEKLADYHAEVLKVAQSLPMTFSGALDQLIEWSDMTIEALAEASEISEKTIQRLRYNEPDNVSIESVVQLCIGMQLEPMLSDYLLKASGKSLMMTAQHTMYYFLLHSYYTHSIYECNEMLADQNLKLLGRKNRGIEAVI